MSKPIKILALSDTHCGHELGLTPPHWNTKSHRGYNMRTGMWEWFDDESSEIKPDIVIFNGDAIDGKGKASGGTEQIYMDRSAQVQIAADILSRFSNAKIYMSYGTAYHTGKEEDWEEVLAEKVGAEKIGGEDNLKVYDTIFNYKHHIGRSTVPYSRATAILKDALWNKLWAERGEYPLADVLIRSHVHYHVYAGYGNLLAMTLPSLQGYGTKYGGRRMTGTVDIGFVTFDVYKNNVIHWRPHIWRAPYAPPMEAI